MTTNIFEGSKVRLRAVEPDDWKIHYEWGKVSEDARATYFIPFPQSTEAVKEWTRKESMRDGEEHEFRLQIETLDGVMVGTINSHSCDSRMGTFAYGLAIMSEHQRQGYATEAIYLLLRYFFMELRYQKVTVEVYSFNERSMLLHERLGFQEEGRLRRMKFTDGRYYDTLFYGMTREEFVDLHLEDTSI